MTERCQSSDCQSGNCPGCRNSSLFCEDPRCYPNCQGCDTKLPGQSNWWLVVIILVLLGLFLILALAVGFGWFRDRKKAAEPKQLTINKHMHTVVPPSIVVQSPAPTVNVQTSSPTGETTKSTTAMFSTDTRV